MLYSTGDKDFRQHVHTTLQRRIRLFLIIGGVSLLIVLYDVTQGTLGVWVALLSIVIGSAVGVITSRIYNLSWDKDGQKVVGQIDMIGWIVLALYILFEVGRNFFFMSVIVTGYDPTAITFAFVSAALVSRVFGLRGRIIRILKDEKVFG